MYFHNEFYFHANIWFFFFFLHQSRRHNFQVLKISFRSGTLETQRWLQGCRARQSFHEGTDWFIRFCPWCKSAGRRDNEANIDQGPSAGPVVHSLTNNFICPQAWKPAFCFFCCFLTWRSEQHELCPVGLRTTTRWRFLRWILHCRRRVWQLHRVGSCSVQKSTAVTTEDLKTWHWC